MSDRLPIVPGCMAVIIGSTYEETRADIGKTVNVIGREVAGTGKVGWRIEGENLIVPVVNMKTLRRSFLEGCTTAICSEKHLMRIDGFNPFSVPSETLKEITHVDY